MELFSIRIQRTFQLVSTAYGMFLVFFEDGKRNRQQGDVADRRCPVSALQFYTSFSDPPVTVVVLYEVVFCQCGYIGEGQPGEGGEDKDVAYQCQSGGW